MGDRGPVCVAVLEPESGNQMTTILAQSGPVIIRYSDRYLGGRGFFQKVTFRGVAIAVQDRTGSWKAKLVRCRANGEKPEDVLNRVGREWLAGEIEGSWQ